MNIIKETSGKHQILSDNRIIFRRGGGSKLEQLDVVANQHFACENFAIRISYCALVYQLQCEYNRVYINITVYMVVVVGAVNYYVYVC